MKKLGMLVHCTRILDHNKDDTDFRRRGAGRIHYVLDTNVCQAFLEPKPNARFVELFHSPRWDAKGDVDAINAQTLLLASEFIFSSHLKGADDKLYMSSPHLTELHTQVTILRRDLLQLSKNKAAAAAVARKYIEDIHSSSRLRSLPRAHVLAAIGKDLANEQYSWNDLHALSERDYIATLDTYIVRSICRFLAQDQLFEPTEQLTRFFSSDFSRRIATLESLFPPDDDALEIIHGHKFTWIAALEEELKLRLKLITDEKERKQEEERAPSIAADGQTMAFLQWASSHRLQPDERVLFVTGDRLILNAYRRWYTRARGTSFLIRPVAQYAPQFNLREAGSRLSNAATVFESTRGVLESVTLRTNLALMNRRAQKPTSPDYDPFSGVRERDRFCLEAEYEGAVDEAFLDDVFEMANNLDVLEREEGRLDMIASLMRKVEVMAVGALPNLVRHRAEQASQRAKQFADLIRGLGDPSEAIGQWVGNRLETALRDELLFAAPLAAQQIKILANLRSATPRAEIGLFIRFPIGDRSYTAPDYVRQLDKQDAGLLLTEIADNPVLIFALASWLAFQHHLWGDAIRYAEFASTVARNKVEQEKTQSTGVAESDGDDFYECKYLKAISLRYRMASVAPDPARDDSDLWRRWLHSAEQELNDCAEHHRAQADQRVQTIRAFSERAAVKLVYCAWAALGHLRKLAVYKALRPDVGKILQSAVADLGYCHTELLRGIKAVPLEHATKEQEANQKALRVLALHVGVNAEPARIIYDILREDQLVEPMPAIDETLAPIVWPDAYLGKKKKSPIVAAYAVSNRARRGESVGNEVAELAGEQDLAQDTAMIQAIVARLTL